MQAYTENVRTEKQLPITHITGALCTPHKRTSSAGGELLVYILHTPTHPQKLVALTTAVPS